MNEVVELLIGVAAFFLIGAVVFALLEIGYRVGYKAGRDKYNA